MQFDMIPVESSNIDYLGYDENVNVMRIWFKGNRIYDYPNVAKEDFEILLSAESVGKAFHATIKPRYTMFNRVA